MASKNVKKSELVADPLAGYTGYQLKTMSGPKLRELIFGKGGGHIPRPGIQEAIAAKIKAWEQS